MRRITMIFLVYVLVMAAAGMPERGQYYVSIPWEDHTTQGVIDLIGDSAFTVPYKLGTFDCGERTAYLDWFLKSHGFDTYICYGKILTDAHVWAAVKTSQGVVYVETTTSPLDIITPDYGRYAAYQNATRTFEDLFEITTFLPETEFDWWSNVRSIPAGMAMTMKMNRSWETVSKEEFPVLV